MRDDIAAYLARLEVAPEPPSIDALRRLHRAHVAIVPWETAWISLGQPWGLDREESLHRIATTERGGYCFHMNGAFSLLLEELGYRVTLHVGGVHGPDGPTVESLANHLALVVADLPTDGNPDGSWYADVGLGDALCEPLPLARGRYDAGPWSFGLTEASDVGDWHFVHDSRGAFTGMNFLAEPATMDDFAAQHEMLSTSPDSQFVKNVIIQRRDPDGVDFLRNAVITRIEGDGTTDRTFTNRSDWFDAVHDRFDVDFAGAEPDALDRLWDRVITTHEAWQQKAQAKEPSSP